MKLTTQQKLALKSLSVGLAILSMECEGNDEFNDFVAEQGWFKQSLDTIVNSIPDAIAEQEETSLDIVLQGDEAEVLASYLGWQLEDVTPWSDGSLTVGGIPKFEYWLIPTDEKLSETVKLHLGDALAVLNSMDESEDNGYYSLYKVDR